MLYAGKYPNNNPRANFLAIIFFALLFLVIGLILGVLFEKKLTSVEVHTTPTPTLTLKTQFTPTASADTQHNNTYNPIKLKDATSGMIFTIPSGWYVGNSNIIIPPSEAHSPLPQGIWYHYWDSIEFALTPTPMQCQTIPTEIIVGTQSARIYYDYDPTGTKTCYPKTGGCQENVYVQLPSPHGNTIEFYTCKQFEPYLLEVLKTVVFDCDPNVCR